MTGTHRSLFGKLLRRRQLWSEMDEEMRQQVELEAEELVRQGVPPAEARQRARLAFGPVESWREEAWEARVPRWLEESGRDLRYATRSLRRAPTFASMAVLCVALGIGVTTTIFGVVNGLLLRPLPFPHPDRRCQARVAALGCSGVGAPLVAGATSDGRSRGDPAGTLPEGRGGEGSPAGCGQPD